MSKLNAGAFEFVPGRAFVLPQIQQPSQQPPKAPIERPPQSEAPPPPPSITLNIGTSTPAAPKSTPAPTKEPKSSLPLSISASAPSSQSSSPAPPTNKVYSTERAKTDTSSIAKEVQAVADREVLKDLFGDGSYHT
jgi:peptide chain release factor subunit 3